MLSNDRMTTFLNSLDPELPAYLYELQQYAIETNVPIIRQQMQSLLRVLLTLKQPGNILEVGCAIGFSALLMREYAPRGCKITTIEKYEKRIPIARENFAKHDPSGQIHLIEGDAMEVLAKMEGSYDMIFMDAAKGQYSHFFPHVMRLLSPGGVLISDNVLQEGDILESRFAVTRRNRTIHSRMREYLYELKHNPELETVILTLGDGTAISIKKGNL